MLLFSCEAQRLDPRPGEMVVLQPHLSLCGLFRGYFFVLRRIDFFFFFLFVSSIRRCNVGGHRREGSVMEDKKDNTYIHHGFIFRVPSGLSIVKAG